MKSLSAAALVAVFYVLHQDVWFWGEARPLVFGFLPIGLFYHAVYTVGCSVLLWLFVKTAWPAHLDPSTPRPFDPSTSSGSSRALPTVRRGSRDE